MLTIKNWDAVQWLRLRYNYDWWECYQTNDWTDTPITYKKTKIVYRALFRTDKDVLFMYLCQNGYVEVVDKDNDVILASHISKLDTLSPTNFIYSVMGELKNP